MASAAILGDSWSVRRVHSSRPTWCELVGTQMAWEVVSLARSGASLSDVRHRQTPEAVGVQWDVGLVLAGVNDIRFGRDPDETDADLVGIVDALGPSCGRLIVFALPRSLGRRPLGTHRWQHGVDRLNRAAHREAARVGATLVDLAHCSGPGFWSADRIHPSPAGHRTIARLVVDVIGGPPLPHRRPGPQAMARYLAGSLRLDR